MWRIESAWFGLRHRVYRVGHTYDDLTWVASFRRWDHAQLFVKAMQR